MESYAITCAGCSNPSPPSLLTLFAIVAESRAGIRWQPVYFRVFLSSSVPWAADVQEAPGAAAAEV